MDRKLSIEGMSCQHCVGRVKKYLESTTNISNVSVDLNQKEACFEFQGNLDSIIKDISGFGFKAREK